MKVLVYNVVTASPTFLCKLFEDNIRVLEIDQYPEINPSTKYINVNYHHFSSYVSNSTISILPIESAINPADISTHPLYKDEFICHHQSPQGNEGPGI